MLLNHRVFQAPSLNASLGEHYVVHPHYRIALKQRRGVICDDRLFYPSGHPTSKARSLLVVSLVGRIRLFTADGEAELAPGEYGLVGYGRAHGIRQEGSQLALTMEWEPGLVGDRLAGPLESGALAPASLRRLKAVAAPWLDDSEAHGVALPSQAAELLAILRSEGLPLSAASPEELRDDIPERERRLLLALDRNLSAQRHQPTLQDLQDELDMSERHIRRLLLEVQERYGFPTGKGWRDHLRGWRLPVAAALMSVKQARTEDVAKMLGFSSPAVFCDVMARAGLPSPRSISDALARLA